MHIINKPIMFVIAAGDMPRLKTFYADKLGMKITSDYKQDDDNWWVALDSPEGGVTITLTAGRENLQPGTMKMYFATSDITAAHKALSDKGVKVNDVKDNLFGPGSGAKWFDLEDPDGNHILVTEAQQTPFASR